VASTYAFVSELLTMIGERGPRIRALTARADSAVIAWGTGSGQTQVPIRARLTTTPYTGEVIVETLEATGDSVRTEPGVRRGMRRTGNYRRVRMPVYDRFTATLTTSIGWGYALGGADTSAVAVLRLHGVNVERVGTACSAPGESFAADSAIVEPRPFQNRRGVRVEGRWQRSDARLDPGTYVVRSGQPLGVLATYLLDPRSDDGLVTWNIGERVADGRLTLAPTRLLSALPSSCGLGPA
jgi:hypothetical protein